MIDELRNIYNSSKEKFKESIINQHKIWLNISKERRLSIDMYIFLMTINKSLKPKKILCIGETFSSFTFRKFKQMIHSNTQITTVNDNYNFSQNFTKSYNLDINNHITINDFLTLKEKFDLIYIEIINPDNRLKYIKHILNNNILPSTYIIITDMNIPILKEGVYQLFNSLQHNKYDIKEFCKGKHEHYPELFGSIQYKNKKPFLSVLTRHFIKRPNYLVDCKKSLSQQTDVDFEHIIFIDNVGRGMAYANKMFTILKDSIQINADYIFILDDDDIILYKDFIKDVKKILEEDDYDIIFFKGHIGNRILPKLKWNIKPQFDDIGSFNFIMKKELYDKYIHLWGETDRGGDYRFLNAAFNNSSKHKWWDKIVCKTQTVNRGKGDK